MSEKQLIAVYTRDSKRYHLYTLDADEEALIVGSLYIKKGEQIPKKLTIELRVKEQEGTSEQAHN